MRIGIDLGGTKTEGVLLAEDGRVVSRRRVETPAREGYEAIVDAVAGLVEVLERDADGRATVGVGIPGTVSADTGLVKNANTTCLIGRPLDRDLADRLGRPVRVQNDANCFAVAEAVGGAGRDGRVVFGVILGTGVGGGLVFDGTARVGRHGIAGEWGHSPIEDRDPDGPPAPACYCGQHGCVETRLSGPAYEADYARLAGLADARVRAPEITRRAEAGDTAAQQAVTRYLAFFGEGLARVLHVVDPDVVVLGGGMANNPWLLERGPAAVEAVLFNPVLTTPIRRHELGDSAGVFGAAWLWGGTPREGLSPVE